MHIFHGLLTSLGALFMVGCAALLTRPTVDLVQTKCGGSESTIGFAGTSFKSKRVPGGITISFERAVNCTYVATKPVAQVRDDKLILEYSVNGPFGYVAKCLCVSEIDLRVASTQTLPRVAQVYENGQLIGELDI